MNLPVDVTIYVQNMKNQILSYEDYFEMLADFGIQDRNKFESLLEEHLTAFSLDAFQANGYPEIEYHQFDDCMGHAVVDYHLESLQEKGLIESVITDDMEIGYRATDAARMASLLNNISLN